MKIKFLIIILLIPFCTVLGNNNIGDKVIIARFVTSPPQDFSQQNEKSSYFSEEIAKSIMGALNRPYELTPIKINSDIYKNDNYLYETLSNCDVAMTVVLPENKKSDLYYSIPYSTINYDVLVRDTMHFNDFSDFNNKTIIIKRNSSVQKKIEKLENEQFKNILYVNTVDIGIKLLAEGTGDYLICDEVSSRQLSKLKINNNIASYKSSIPPLKVVFVSKDEALINDINNALGVLNSKNTYSIIYNKMYGPKEQKGTQWYIYSIILSVLAILTVLVFIIFILRKLVRKATRESKEAFNKIRELNHSISLLIQNSKVDIYIYDINEMILYTLEDDNYRKKQITEDELIKYIHNEDKNTYYKEYQDFIDGKLEFMIAHLRIFNKMENKFFFYEYVLKPLKKDYSGKVERFMFSRKNETEKQERLQEQDELIQSFNLALKAAKLGRWEYNINTSEIKIINNTLNEIHLSKDEFVNFIIPADRKKFNDYLVKTIFLKEKETIIVRFISQNINQNIICEISSLIKYDSHHNPIVLFGIINDLSDIKFIQDKVFELQYNMQIALDSGELSIWRYDKINNDFTILHGTNLNEGHMSHDEYNKFIHPDDRHYLLDGIEEVLNRKTDKTTVKFRMNIQGTGKWRWYSCSMIAMPSEDEKRYIIGTRKDITKEVEDKDKLEEMNKELELSYKKIESNQEYLRTILDKLPIPIFIKDPLSQKHIYINEEANKSYFVTPKFRPEDVLIKEQSDYCKSVDEQIVKTGEEYSAYENLHLLNGRIINTFVKKILIEYNGEKQILVVRSDLSRRHRSLLSKNIFSSNLHILKAYTWSYTTKDYIINFGETFMLDQRSIHDINTLDKFMSLIHPDDRESCKKNINDYLKKGKGEYSMTYRMDLTQKGVYEWWESKSIVETIRDANETYLLIYGVEINVNDKKSILINN